MIPRMKQMPEWKGSWRSANESVDDPFNQPKSQTSWALTGCKQPLFCTAWEEAFVFSWCFTIAVKACFAIVSDKCDLIEETKLNIKSTAELWLDWQILACSGEKIKGAGTLLGLFFLSCVTLSTGIFCLGFKFLGREPKLYWTDVTLVKVCNSSSVRGFSNWICLWVCEYWSALTAWRTENVCIYFFCRVLSDCLHYDLRVRLSYLIACTMTYV